MIWSIELYSLDPTVQGRQVTFCAVLRSQNAAQIINADELV